MLPSPPPLMRQPHEQEPPPPLLQSLTPLLTQLLTPLHPAGVTFVLRLRQLPSPYGAPGDKNGAERRDPCEELLKFTVAHTPSVSQKCSS